MAGEQGIDVFNCHVQWTVVTGRGSSIGPLVSSGSVVAQSSHDTGAPVVSGEPAMNDDPVPSASFSVRQYSITHRTPPRIHHQLKQRCRLPSLSALAVTYQRVERIRVLLFVVAKPEHGICKAVLVERPTEG